MVGESFAHRVVPKIGMKSFGINALSPNIDAGNALCLEFLLHLRTGDEREIGPRMRPSQHFPAHRFNAGHEAQIVLSVGGQMRVVAHDERYAEDAGVKNSRKQEKSGTRDVNQIGLRVFHHAGTLHFGQVEGEGYLVVQGKGETKRVSNFVAKGLRRQLLPGSLGVDGENFHLVVGFSEELEQFLEAIGVTGHVSEGRGLHEQGNFARRMPAERRCARRFRRGVDFSRIERRRGGEAPHGRQRWHKGRAAGAPRRNQQTLQQKEVSKAAPGVADSPTRAVVERLWRHTVLVRPRWIS